jgi:hypothetical protein
VFGLDVFCYDGSVNLKFVDVWRIKSIWDQSVKRHYEDNNGKPGDRFRNTFSL